MEQLGDQSILHVAANGEMEWGGTFYKHVRPSLLNYRHQTNVLGHQLIGYGIGHGNYIDAGGSAGWGLDHPGKVQCVDTWKYLSIFIKVIALRVPEGCPTTEPLCSSTLTPAKAC